MKVLRDYPCVEVAAADLFADPAFAAWVKEGAGHGLATWHHRDFQVGESSDVFIVVDTSGECGDSPENKFGMPRAAWDKVAAVLAEAGWLGRYMVVRLLPVEDY